MRKRVVGYVRISPRPDEGESLEMQAERVKAYCATYDLELVGIVEDRLISGKDMVARPALEKALAALRNGDAVGLVVLKIDRLTRNIGDLHKLVTEYFSGPFELHGVLDRIDTSTANGRMFLYLTGLFAQWERETIVERTKAQMAYLKSQGVTFGQPHFGSRRRKGGEGERTTIEESPEEAAIVARIKTLSLEGNGVRAIAARLDAEGIQPRKGKGRWHPTQVQRVLTRARVGA